MASNIRTGSEEVPSKNWNARRMAKGQRCEKNKTRARKIRRSPACGRLDAKSKAVPDSRTRQIFLPEVPRILLQLPRDRGHAARHRAPRTPFRPRVQGGRRALHQIRPGGKSAPATPPQGPRVRIDVHALRPGEAPLHGLRIQARGVPRIPRQPALRILRVPEVRARPPGRPGVHRPYVSCDLRAFSRIADRVVAGVMASGSILSSMIAGFPEAAARS